MKISSWIILRYISIAWKGLKIFRTTHLECWCRYVLSSLVSKEGKVANFTVVYKTVNNLLFIVSDH